MNEKTGLRVSILAYLLLFALVFLVATPRAKAQEQGQDLLGGAKFQQAAITGVRDGTYVGVFANTFGEAFPYLNRLLSERRIKGVRIHAVWQDNHQYNEKRDLPVILKELQRANKLKERFPDREVYFSPFCEHNIKGQQLKSLFDKVQKNAKGLILVNSVMNGDYLASINGQEIIQEIHGNHSAPNLPYIYSFDGLAAVDANVEDYKAKHKKSRIFFMWTSQYNGRRNPLDTTPRPQRTFWASADLIRGVDNLFNPKGATSLGKKDLWKAFSDQHVNPAAPRELKPVYITPLKLKSGESLELVKNGKVLMSTKNGQPFNDGRTRFYFSEWGFKLSTSPVQIVHKKKSGQVVLGSVNPGFRENDYRNK